jgi:hypothetical protein
VNASSEISTSTPVVPGETPSAVFIRPNTIHGCRPISVKIHPTTMASSDSGIAQIAIRHCHARAGMRPLRVSQRPVRAIRMWSPPRPIIHRNAQYVTQMIGV